MTTVNAETMVVSLALHDVPLHYQTAKGPPVGFELDYSYRDAEQPAIFTYTNFGPRWTSNWISYVIDNTIDLGAGQVGGNAELYLPGGGAETYTFDYNIVSLPGVDDQTLVESLSAFVHVGFVRELPDGSRQTFAHPFGFNPTLFFLSSVSDPQGNTVTLTYDGNDRITAITDAAGQKTTLTYGLADDIYKVTKVTDPFGRSATFTYNADGELASITDTLGITSSYTYLFGSGDFISTLTTPYGVSTFTYGDSIPITAWAPPASLP